MQIFEEELNAVFKDTGITVKREIARRLIRLALDGNLRAISELIEKSEPNFKETTPPVDLGEIADAIKNNYSVEGREENNG